MGGACGPYGTDDLVGGNLEDRGYLEGLELGGGII
jgi:hypothetical protein